MASDRFAPLIIAAGRGSRMGAPKALLEIEGQTALARCLETCRQAAAQLASDPAERGTLASPIVVCGHGAAEVRARFADDTTPIRLVENPAPDRGQTSSVQTGLTAMTADLAGCLVFPVDHPLATAGDLAALVEVAVSHPTALIVRPSHAGRAGHPALIRRELRPAIMALGPDEPLRNVMQAHHDLTLFATRPEPGILFDLDTPDDLQAAIAYLRRLPQA